MSLKYFTHSHISNTTNFTQESLILASVMLVNKPLISTVKTHSKIHYANLQSLGG